MGRTTHRLRVVEARRYHHPVFKTVEKHLFIVRAKDLPPGIRADANAREASGINRQVYKDVRDSLLGQNSTPGSFDLMNKGITILAHDVKRVDESNYDVVVGEGQGIVDGGHTYKIITDNALDENLPDEQHVEINVRVGIPDKMITDIARGLNTGIQVKQHSLANLDGAFEWLKEEISGEPYAKLISWREGDDGEYDVRDLICVLEALNVIDFPKDNATHPIQAYEKWSIPAGKFAKDFKAQQGKRDFRDSTYHRLRPLLKGGLKLMDRIRRDFRDIHNAGGGLAGQMKILEKARDGSPFEFPFARLQPSQYRLTKGATYPIFAAFRNAVELDEDGRAKWKESFDDVLKLWEEAGPELVSETFLATKEVGNLPDQLGKSRGHWANLHRVLELRMLRKRVAVARRH